MSAQEWWNQFTKRQPRPRPEPAIRPATSINDADDLARERAGAVSAAPQEVAPGVRRGTGQAQQLGGKQ